jgi:hypothetical protein
MNFHNPYSSCQKYVPIELLTVTISRSRRMFEIAGDDMISFFPESPRHTEDGVVVRFRAAAGKENFGWTAVKDAVHLSAGILYGLFGFDAVPVGTGRVAEFGFQKRPHGLNHFRIMGCGAVVIQINRFDHDRFPHLKMKLDRPERIMISTLKTIVKSTTCCQFILSSGTGLLGSTRCFAARRRRDCEPLDDIDIYISLI